MKRLIFLPLMLALLLVLAGCIESTTVVRVNKNGSGTIEQTFAISAAFMELLSGFGGEEMEGEDSSLFEEQDFRDGVSGLGEGVVFVSAEEIETDIGTGYRVLYEFEDVNKIRINQNPGEIVPSVPGGEEEEAPKEYVLFNFKKGNTATLEIINPVQPPEPGQEESDDVEIDEETLGMMEMMKEFYKDMKIGLIIEVDGRITKTNATYHEASQVTLMELDFAKLLEDEDRFRQLITSDPQTIEEVKKIAEDIPGIKVETEEVITVDFR